MSSYNPHAEFTATAGAAMPEYVFVTPDLGSGVALAGAASVNALGTTMRPAFGAGDFIPVVSVNAGSSRFVIAAVAINQGADLFLAANGQVSNVGSVRVGTAKQTVAAGAVFEAFIVPPVKVTAVTVPTA